MASATPAVQQKADRFPLIKKFVDIVQKERDLKEDLEKTSRRRKEMLARHPFLGQIVGLSRRTPEEGPAPKRRRVDVGTLSLESTPAAKQRMSQEAELKKLIQSLDSRVRQKKAISSTTVSQVVGLCKKLGVAPPEQVQQATTAGLVLNQEAGLGVDTVMHE